MTDLVSVVIPAYNAAQFLGPALDSVARQTYRSFETIVVDDGSIDDTADVVREYPEVRYLYQSNLGVAHARNAGVEAARGRWVAFLDADDLWLPHKLERQVELLARSPGCSACATAFNVVDDDMRVIETRGAPDPTPTIVDLLLRGNLVGTPSTVMCEKDVLEVVGGFDPAFSQNADWDLWIRIRARSPFAFTDEPLVLYRRHERNMSRSVRLLERDTQALLVKVFGSSGLPDSVKALESTVFARQGIVVAGSYMAAGDYRAFARNVFVALRHDWRTATVLLADAARRRLVHRLTP